VTVILVMSPVAYAPESTKINAPYIRTPQKKHLHSVTKETIDGKKIRLKLLTSHDTAPEWTSE
jgi:hypothetical protein